MFRISTTKVKHRDRRVKLNDWGEETRQKAEFNEMLFHRQRRSTSALADFARVKHEAREAATSDFARLMGRTQGGK